MNAFAQLLVLFRWLILAGFMVGATGALAVKTYSDNGNGTVTDPTTGLIWMRCAVGQLWDVSTCTGTATQFTWDEANALTRSGTFAGKGDWRLPSIRELLTIVDRTVNSPVLDTVAFPNTSAYSNFWSSSAYFGNLSSAWYVGFGMGGAYDKAQSSTFSVRMVRADQSSGLLDTSRPDADYVNHADGTVTHTPSGLVWQKCAVGQVLSSTGTCTGTPSTYTWDEALLLTSSLAGQTDWRLPTEDELLSLVDYSADGAPFINVSMFPNAEASDFWSATANSGSSERAFSVDFYDGVAYDYLYKINKFQVRLVRAGPSLALLPLSVRTIGTGQVTTSTLGGIDCGVACAGSYSPGTTLILSAVPAVNFVAWSGACTGSTATCTVTMDVAKTVTAQFVEPSTMSTPNTTSTAVLKTYSDHGNGTVTDPTTGLMWMRCAMGLQWDGSTCTGTATTHTWAQARAFTGTVTFAGKSDWRLPTIRELQTVVDRAVWKPATDRMAFPGVDSVPFWSASSYFDDSNAAWFVEFNGGQLDKNSKSSTYQVRLVRGGQSGGLLNVSRPNTDYVDQGDGTVTHTPTGLVWQKCAIGQNWSVSACTGTARAYPWDVAKVLISNLAGQTDWRLPTEEELLSLVDYNTSAPALNANVFPGVSAAYFWSDSLLSGKLFGAWSVDFNAGLTKLFSWRSTMAVRLVRAGRSLAPLALTLNKNGTGTVRSSPLSGMDCGTICTGSFTPGTTLILSATPAANFIAWGGACSGSSANCTVTMDAAKTVTAQFIDVTPTTPVTTFNVATYLPLQTGNTWTLNEYISDTDSTVLNQNVMRVSTTTAVNGVSTYQVTGMPGATNATVYLTSDANGIRWHGSELFGNGGDAIVQALLPITWMGTEIGPDTAIFLTPAGSVRLNNPELTNINGSYQARITVSPSESVTVPAGTFMAKPLEFSIDYAVSDPRMKISPQNLHGKLWLAQGVGVVKAIDWTANGQKKYFRLADTNVAQTASTTTTTVTTTTTTQTPSLSIAPQITAGRFHSMALDRSGTLYSWGADNFGQLGLGRQLVHTTPGRLSQVGSYVTTSAGGGTSYAIDAEGYLWSWGLSDVGQLGDGTYTNRSTPIKVGGDFKAISAGYYHVLAIKKDGTLWAWGYNAYGALGDGTQTDSLKPKQIGSGRYKAISAGVDHSLAVAEDGSVWAWGNNSSGQLGDGTTVQQFTPVKVINVGALSVAAGPSHSVVLLVDGTVLTWGKSFGGTQQTRVIDGIVAIAAGAQHNLALKSNGDLWAWGGNEHGEIGNGGKSREYLPLTKIGSNYSSIAAGLYFSAAITTDGRLWMWGKNVQGQLGLGNQIDALSPVLVGDGYSRVSVGQSHTLAVRTDGSLWGWGYGANGELASSLGDGMLRSTPMVVGSGFIKAQAGGDHNLAIKADGSLWTWGTNFYGQLGDGTYSYRSKPVKIGQDYAEIAGGLNHSLAIKADGSLWAWGGNSYGQIGIGQTSGTVATPVRIGSGMKAVAAGKGHSLGLTTEGKLWAWGDNSYGQLGLGNTTSQTTPTLVGGDYVAIAAGDAHSLALKADGSLWAWGSNDAGQVGDGQALNNSRLSPYKVGSNFVAIGKGRWASFGIKDDGSVWTWGEKQTDYFSDIQGVFAYSATPVQVAAQGVIGVTGGGAHDLLLRSDGRILAWGYNQSGQLGDGTFASRNGLGAVANPLATDFFDVDPQAANDPIPLDIQVPFFVKTDMNAFVETTINLDDSAQNEAVAYGAVGYARSDSRLLGSGGPLDPFDGPVPDKKIQSVAPLVPIVLTSQGWKLQSETGTDMEAIDVSTQASGKTITLYETRLVDRRSEDVTLCVITSLSNAKNMVRSIVTGVNGSLGCPRLNLAPPSTTTTTSTTTSTTFITTTTSTTTSTLVSIVETHLVTGWNLVGNGIEAVMDVATTLGDATKVNTVWKWVVSGTTPSLGYPAWAFYTPSLADGGKAYAVSKGYDALTTIQAGEGFWVNAKAGFALTLPVGAVVTSSSFTPVTGFHALGKGWNLIATGDKPTPSVFHQSVGVLPINLTTLWAWDAVKSGWYFWAPGLANDGNLAAYLTQKGYLDFSVLTTIPPGTLSPTTGFWVNRP